MYVFFFLSLNYFIVGTQGYPSQFYLNFLFFFREVGGQWIEEEKLEAHSDWVRDVAWALNDGLPVSTFACVPRKSNLQPASVSCSGLLIWGSGVTCSHHIILFPPKVTF